MTAPGDAGSPPPTDPPPPAPVGQPVYVPYPVPTGRPGFGVAVAVAIAGTALTAVVACCGGAALLPMALAPMLEDVVGEALDASESCVGRTYPDQRPDDVCADAGGGVFLTGLRVFSTPLARDGAGRVCTAVTIVNESGGPLDARTGWTLAPPMGPTRTADLILQPPTTSTAVAADSSRAGTLCFPPTAGSGQWRPVYEPTQSNGMRGVWQHRL
ncbi:hypothetical protein GCM10010123_03330 [Pilimelia anulata]|uniref:Uncharacterized protein n=1 Tax=Pilimelia anulata TaxID=53371 RepID=A0A8J3B711_9ACTN|nr:hypothetical protein [Pilimelia anulata]GGJ76671.1 hypothetical protein GCM10010123_03330 [Pilimelia anulata]